MTHRFVHPRRWSAGLLGLLAFALVSTTATSLSPAHAAGALPPIKHVWVVMLENESEQTAWEGDPKSYLSFLKTQGAFVPNYYGIGHLSLDNYIALVSGEAPMQDTQSDCQVYADSVPNANDNTVGGQGQNGSGCVYESGVDTIGDAVTAVGKTWKGYMEDMGLDSHRDTTVTCSTPTNQQDPTQNGEQGDQYTLRHDPFMYFHNVIDHPSTCLAHVAQLQDARNGLVHDLQSASTTPNYSLVVPNLCDDGHDPSSTSPPGSGCAGPDAAGKSNTGLAAINDWLSIYIPVIMNSPAFRQDGALVITFDEGGGNPSSSDYATACCDESNMAGTEAEGGANCNAGQCTAGGNGPGGGRVGALVLSPYANPGTQSSYDYNHFSLLRGIQDLLGATRPDSHINNNSGYLGWAGSPSNYGNIYPGPCDVDSSNHCTGPMEFGSDVFTNKAGTANPQAEPAGAPPPPPPPLNFNTSTTPMGAAATSGPSTEAMPPAIAAFGGTVLPSQPAVVVDSGGQPTASASATPSAAASRALGNLLGPAPPASGGSMAPIWASVLVALAAVAGAVLRLGRRT